MSLKQVIFCVIFVMLAAISAPILYCHKHPCIRSHKGWVYYPAPTLLVPCGKVLIPIFQPARNSYETICDERK